MCGIHDMPHLAELDGWNWRANYKHVVPTGLVPSASKSYGCTRPRALPF
jgi:hypothetical protein